MPPSHAGEAAGAPAKMFGEVGGERPAHGAGKAGDEGDAGNGLARMFAMQPDQCGKGGVIKNEARSNFQCNETDEKELSRQKRQ